jgi:hypothetical protein
MFDFTALAASFGDALGTRLPAAFVQALSEQVRSAIGCRDCGTRSPVVALAWAHRDEATKYRTRSGRVEDPADLCKASGDGRTRYALRVILAEWSKCDVLCANCHMLETWPGRNYPRPLTPWSWRDSVALVDAYRARGGGEVRLT